MSNMSYCRFENTLSDMNDCLAALDEMVSGDEQLLRSGSELRAMRLMHQAAEDLMERIDEVEERIKARAEARKKVATMREQAAALLAEAEAMEANEAEYFDDARK